MKNTATPKTTPKGTPASREQASLRIACRPRLMISLLILTDALMITLAGLLSVLGRSWLGGQFRPMIYLKLSPVFLVIIGAYAGSNLYRSAPVNVTQEIRRVFTGTTLVYLGMGTMTFFLRDALLFSRAIFLVAWLQTIIAVLLGRWLLRSTLARRSWWGYPTVVLGVDKQARKVIKDLIRIPQLGLTPVANLTDRMHMRHSRFANVPVIHNLDAVTHLSSKPAIPCVLLVMHNVSNDTLAELLARHENLFRRVITLPDPGRPGTVPVAAWRFAGVHGAEVKHDMPGWLRAAFKRMLDLSMILLASPVLLIVILLIGLIVKLDSPGPVFYGHPRMGRNGKKFKIWKIRTMVHDAERVLNDHLNENVDMKLQWDRQHKLKNDPRITRLGRFLRRMSLDELPQVWNVLLGQMSIVGPRPIVEKEVPRYGEAYVLYKQVRPGITGCWQVSGRNDTSYHERVQIDMYYARNWSTWLDLWVLASTIPTVLRRRGAY